MISLDTFIQETAETLKNPRWADLRFGQVYMNLLHNRRRDLYDLISGIHLDPFYNEQKITEFWTYLKDNW